MAVFLTFGGALVAYEPDKGQLHELDDATELHGWLEDDRYIEATAALRRALAIKGAMGLPIKFDLSPEVN